MDDGQGSHPIVRPMKKGPGWIQALAFKTLYRALDSHAVFHIAAVVAGVGIEIVWGAMIQQVAGTQIPSNIDANSYRPGRHRSPPNDANPGFFRHVSTHFHHCFWPNLPLRLLLPDQS